MGVAIIVGIVVALVLTCLVVLHVPPSSWFGKFLTQPKSADLFAQIAQSAVTTIRSYDKFIPLEDQDVRRYLLASWYWYVNESNDVLTPTYQDVVEKAYWDAEENIRAEAEEAYMSVKGLARDYVLTRFTTILKNNPNVPDLLEDVLITIADKAKFEKAMVKEDIADKAA